MHTERGRGVGRKRRGEETHTVFVLPNDLQKETVRSGGAVSVDVSELVFHIHHHFSTLEVLIAYDLN